MRAPRRTLTVPSVSSHSPVLMKAHDGRVCQAATVLGVFSAAVDVARIRPKLTLSELRQPFLERIGRAVFKAPF